MTTDDIIFKDNFEKLRITKPAAARFLNQATFGATKADIEYLQSIDYKTWIDEQIEMPPTLFVADFQEQVFADHVSEGGEATNMANLHVAAFWHHAGTARDQLRHRVAFSLSQFFVISDFNFALNNVISQTESGYLKDASSNFYDLLLNNLFGNFRDLLELISKDIGMGKYLNMVDNIKSDPESETRPDENFAREVLQLFSIGLVELNIDGTLVLDGSGRSIPTYNQETIENFARIFTGWEYKTHIAFTNDGYVYVYNEEQMVSNELNHDVSSKTLLNGEVVPAGNTAQQDLSAALDNIFNHPNVAPFFCTFLIKHLVTSNPTAEYISHVSRVFANNGRGVRGDLSAVYKAILLHPEARNGHIQYPDVFGRFREPLVRGVHLLRALKAKVGDMRQLNGSAVYPDYIYTYLIFEELYSGVLTSNNRDFEYTSQVVNFAKSVFNFYSTDYQLPGEIIDNNLYSPEFQISTETQITTCNNWLDRYAIWIGNLNYFDTQEEQLLAQESMELLIDHLNLIFMSGQMSDEMYTALINNDGGSPENNLIEAVRHIIQSPEYVIQK